MSLLSIINVIHLQLSFKIKFNIFIEEGLLTLDSLTSFAQLFPWVEHRLAFDFAVLVGETIAQEVIWSNSLVFDCHLEGVVIHA